MAEVFFAEQKNGYDKTQVDNYIQMLTKSYQKAYKEYTDISGKYNELLQDYKKMEAEKQGGRNGLNADIIAKALINSEKLAKEITDNAYSEEARLVAQTKNNLEQAYKTVEKAFNEAQKFLTLQSRKDLGGIGVTGSTGSTGGILDGIEVPK
jgi:cell division septum initiation protein DivIVA